MKAVSAAFTVCRASSVYSFACLNSDTVPCDFFKQFQVVPTPPSMSAPTRAAIKWGKPQKNDFSEETYHSTVTAWSTSVVSGDQDSKLTLTVLSSVWSDSTTMVEIQTERFASKSMCKNTHWQTGVVLTDNHFWRYLPFRSSRCVDRRQQFWHCANNVFACRRQCAWP